MTGGIRRGRETAGILVSRQPGEHAGARKIRRTPAGPPGGSEPGAPPLPGGDLRTLRLFFARLRAKPGKCSFVPGAGRSLRRSPAVAARKGPENSGAFRPRSRERRPVSGRKSVPGDPFPRRQRSRPGAFRSGAGMYFCGLLVAVLATGEAVDIAEEHLLVVELHQLAAFRLVEGNDTVFRIYPDSPDGALRFIHMGDLLSPPHRRSLLY